MSYYGNKAGVRVSGDPDDKLVVVVSMITSAHEYLLGVYGSESGALKRAEDIIRDLDEDILDVSDIAKKYRMKKRKLD